MMGTTTAVLLILTTALLLSGEMAAAAETHLHCEGAHGNFVVGVDKITLQPSNVELFLSFLGGSCEAHVNHSSSGTVYFYTKQGSRHWVKMNFEREMPHGGKPSWESKQVYVDGHSVRPIPSNWVFHTEAFRCSGVKIPLNSGAWLEVTNLRVAPFVEEGHAQEEHGECG